MPSEWYASWFFSTFKPSHTHDHPSFKSARELQLPKLGIVFVYFENYLMHWAFLWCLSKFGRKIVFPVQSIIPSSLVSILNFMLQLSFDHSLAWLACLLAKIKRFKRLREYGVLFLPTLVYYDHWNATMIHKMSFSDKYDESWVWWSYI